MTSVSKIHEANWYVSRCSGKSLSELLIGHPSFRRHSRLMCKRIKVLKRSIYFPSFERDGDWILYFNLFYLLFRNLVVSLALVLQGHH